MCRICGEDTTERVIRYWDPDDGWVAGRLCQYCREYAGRVPQPEDYAWDKRDDIPYADLEQAISEIYG